MYKLEVKNPCRCFMRDGGVDVQQFHSLQEVQEEAQMLLERMEKSYCKKHRFVLTKTAGHCTITIMSREMK